MYDSIILVFMTVRQASIFDANHFCHHISQLTQLMSGNIPHPERFDQMIHHHHHSSLLKYILSKEKNHCSILSRIHEKNPCSKVPQVPTTLMISSRICLNKIYALTVKTWFAKKEMLQIYMISVTAKDKSRLSASKKGVLKTIQLARNILNQLPVKFPAYQLLHAMRSGTLGTEHLDWHSCNRTCYQLFSNFIGMQLSLKMCLHLTNVLW